MQHSIHKHDCVLLCFPGFVPPKSKCQDERMYEDDDQNQEVYAERKRWLPPQRYLATVTLLLGITISFTARLSWPAAKRHMVNRNRTNLPFSSAEECNVSSNASLFIPVTERFFDWSPETSDMFQKIFLTGYIIGHTPSGVLADIYGPKHFIGLPLLAASLLHLATPGLLFITDGHYMCPVIINLLLGLALGVLFPSANTFVANWSPPRERSSLSGISYAGTQFALGFRSGVTDDMIFNTNKWSIVFYVYGSLLLIWVLFFYCFCYSKPEDDPRITREEILFIHKELDGIITYGKKPIRWKKILTSLPVWALVIGSWGHYFFWHILTDVMSKYQSSLLGYQNKTPLILALPYWIMGISTILNGFFVDYIINKKYIHITTARKIYTTLGCMGPSLFLISGSYSGCHVTAAAAIYHFAMILKSCYYAGLRTNTIDLAPNFSGTIMSMVNGSGAIVGILASLTIKSISPNNTIVEWRSVCWLTLAVLTVTNVVFMMFGTGVTQWWNNLEADEDSGFTYDSKITVSSEYSESETSETETVKFTTELQEFTSVLSYRPRRST